jgi:hypothetical protein
LRVANVRPAPPASRRAALLAAIVFVAAILVYARCVHFDFAYDDRWTIQDNRALDGALAPLLRSVFSGKAALKHVPDATRPLMVASMWVDKRLFAGAPAGYHWHSLLLYGLSAVTAFLALFAITRRRAAAFIGGLLFAAFPLHAEVVCSVNYREDLHAAIAVFGAVACLFWPGPKRRGIEAAVHVSALVLAGLLGKESAIAVVGVVLALVIVLLRPSAIAGWFSSRRAAVTGVTGVVVLWSAYRAALRLAGRDDVPLALAHRGVVERALRTCRYLVRTTFDGLVPVSWSPEYAPEGAASFLWSLPLALVVLAVVLAARRGRFTRTLAAGVAVALVAGLPTSPLVSPINETADRYAFVATLGGALFWGATIERATRRRAGVSRCLVIAAVMVPLVFVSQRAAAPWRSNDALWASAIERAPASPRAWAAWSHIVRRRGDLDAAEHAASRATELGPESFAPRVARIYVLLARGKVDEARTAIGELRRMGGGRMPGVRRAAGCAELRQGEILSCLERGPIGPRPAGSVEEGPGHPVPAHSD